MTKPVGAKQRKPKKWVDTKKGRDPNYALAAFRKVKKAQKAKKAADMDEYNSLCGKVTITKIEPTMAHLLEARLERQTKRASRLNGMNSRALGTNPRAKKAM